MNELTEEQEKALTDRYILLIQTRKMPLAVELKNTLTILGVLIPKIHEASASDIYHYRQSAIRGS